MRRAQTRYVILNSKLLRVLRENASFDEFVDELLHAVEHGEERERRHDDSFGRFRLRSFAVASGLEGYEVKADHVASEVDLADAVGIDFFLHLINTLCLVVDYGFSRAQRFEARSRTLSVSRRIRIKLNYTVFWEIDAPDREESAKKLDFPLRILPILTITLIVPSVRKIQALNHAPATVAIACLPIYASFDVERATIIPANF